MNFWYTLTGNNRRYFGQDLKKKKQTHLSDLGAYKPATYSEFCIPACLLSHWFCMTKSFCVIFDGCILNTCETGATVQQVTKNQAGTTADTVSHKPAHTQECLISICTR